MWYKIAQAAAAEIRTFFNRGRGGTYYVVIRPTADQPLTELAALGYKIYKGAYTKQVIPDNIDLVQTELQTIPGINMSGLNDIRKAFAPAPVAVAPTQEGGEATETIIDFAQQLKAEMSKTPAGDQADVMRGQIAQHLEQLAASVDEASKEEFIRDYMAFSVKFWHYSLSNQFLIYFQSKGQATRVAGRKKWEREYGRKVTVGNAEGYSILAPRQSGGGKIDTDDIEKALNFVQTYIRANPTMLDISKSANARKFFGSTKYRLKQQHMYLWKKAKNNGFTNLNQLAAYLQRIKASGKGDSGGGGPMTFVPVLVYDVSQTEPIPGRKAFEPISQDVWQSQYNDPEEKASILANAAMAFAADSGITVDTSEDTGRAGGYSAGGHISTHYASQGQRLLSTIFHELAHELLHWDETTKATMTHEQMEIDAEATAAWLMGKFGYDTSYAAKYLALKGVSGKQITQRLPFVFDAVNKIEAGIRSKIVGDEGEKQASITGNWYRRLLKASCELQDFLEIF